ncbi:MAG: hypothetical protein CM1200mP31_0530 [Candidatus Neomarinimicrobiota bacterium]|nr:MAG: hypothetical protein CM1200mP31_0530 [Candidatus Neomarinimicrobiota bacterium]
MKSKTKFIFVLGGVMSGLGKGISASSIGYLLKSAGLKVNILKLDPYLNVDPGTMNPYQHGEVFVLDDGSETDLDWGIMRDLSMKICLKIIMLPLDKYIVLY